MRTFVAIILAVVVCSNSYSQDDTLSMDIRFTGLILANKTYQFEFYSLEANRYVLPRTMIGIQVGTISLWDKSNLDANNQKFVTTGCKWNLIKDRRWYIDPSAHLIYFSFINSIAGSKYRGGGAYISVSSGVRIHQFKIGAKIHAHYTYGLLQNPGGYIEERFAPFLEINYGLNLAYTF